ncbi:MAG TPA: hypothetical protein VKT82_34890 [Ktedonobacterales bacterium]|nr:hypothetical protein [Ktedonobacterales bacterium]
MSSATTLDFTLRYQRTPGEKYHVRPLTLLQQDILYRCDGRVTVADLSDATKYSHPEIRAVLAFLNQHGLVKILPPDPRLFAALAHHSAAFSSDSPQGHSLRVLPALKRTLRAWNDRLWYGLTWDVHGQ